MQKFWFVFGLVFWGYWLDAQQLLLPVGARASGMGGASVTVGDVWAAFNNPAGLTQIRQMSGAVAYEKRSSIGAFNSGYAAFALPVGKVASGAVSFRKFGDAVFSEQVASLAFAHKINTVSLGVKTNFVQYAMQDLPTKTALTFEMGGIVQLSESLWLGGYVYNFTQSQLADFRNEKIPTVIKTGLSYRPSKRLMCNLEAEKDTDKDLNIRAGVEYFLVEKFAVRTGISTQPRLVYGGIGFQHRLFEIDYSVNSHQYLAAVHQLSLVYKFGKSRGETVKEAASH